MIRVYSDFNCPFCFVQHLRIKQLDLAEQVDWRFIEHAPNFCSRIRSVADSDNMAAEVAQIKLRSADIVINLPDFCVNTRLAILSFISLQKSHPELALDFISQVYCAYWQESKDISDTIILRGILNNLGVNLLDISSEAEAVQNTWQIEWRNTDFENRIPAMSSSENRILLGLQHQDNINNFIKNSPEVVMETGIACAFQEKGNLAFLTGDQVISEKVISADIFDRYFFCGLNELITHAVQYRPDIVIVDYQLDKTKSFQTIELLKKMPDSLLKNVPIVYYFNQAPCEQEKATAFTLGAIDSFSIEDDFAVIHAKLKRRVMDSRKLFQLSENSTIDSLTGVYNRREFNVMLERLWRMSCRQQIRLSLVMVDIDFFKQYNDHYGHLEGDSCLIKIASILQQCAKRSSDIVARFGGEEFILVLFDIEASEALKIVENMRVAIEEANIKHKNRLGPQKITASFGVCSLQPHPDHSLNETIEVADKAMYLAKSQGRNRVCCEQITPPNYQ